MLTDTLSLFLLLCDVQAKIHPYTRAGAVPPAVQPSLDALLATLDTCTTLLEALLPQESYPNPEG